MEEILNLFQQKQKNKIKNLERQKNNLSVIVTLIEVSNSKTIRNEVKQ